MGNSNPTIHVHVDEKLALRNQQLKKDRDEALENSKAQEANMKSLENTILELKKSQEDQAKKDQKVRDEKDQIQSQFDKVITKCQEQGEKINSLEAENRELKTQIHK